MQDSGVALFMFSKVGRIMDHRGRSLRTGVALIGSGLFASALLIGCASNSVEKRADRYQAIRVHSSTQSEVTASLGEPNHRLGNKWIYEWEDEHRVVMIDFDESGKVVRKQWVDAQQWQDTDDQARTASDK